MHIFLLSNASRVRPQRRKVVDPSHIGNGVEFKVRAGSMVHNNADQHIEVERVSKVIKAVKHLVSHLSDDAEPIRIFRHAGMSIEIILCKLNSSSNPHTFIRYP